jgi:hypothetical protein
MDKGARPLHQPAVAFPPSPTRRTCLLGVSSLCLYRVSRNECLKLLPVPDVSQYISLPTSAYRVAHSQYLNSWPMLAYWVSQGSAYTGCLTISVSIFCLYRVSHSICLCPCLPTGWLTTSTSIPCPRLPTECLTEYLKYLPLSSYRVSRRECFKSVPTPAYWAPQASAHTGCLTISVSSLCPYHATMYLINCQIPVRIEFSRQRLCASRCPELCYRVVW